MQNADSVYDRTHPWDSLPERILTDALSVANIPGDVLALQSAPPPVVRPLFPPRFGYRDTALGIQDVLQVDKVYPSPSTNSYTGTQGGYSGSSRPTIGGF
jgi:hypothetical protein